jgi:hypothetical protein
MLDLKTSIRLGEKFFELGIPWLDVVSRAIEALNELGDKAFYVEGWEVGPRFNENPSDTVSGEYIRNRGWRFWREGNYSANEHCWVEIDTRIIEPTLFGIGIRPLFYYPGVYYSKAEIINALKKTQNKTPVNLLINDWDPNLDSAYGAAGKQALQKMIELSEQKQTPRKRLTYEEIIKRSAQKIIKEFESKKD